MTAAGFRAHPIGVVRSRVTEPVDLDWGAVESRIVLEPGHGTPRLATRKAAAGCGRRFVRKPARHLVRRPRGLAELPELGIFAQRAKDRPNPLGVTVVELVSVEPDGITVRGLDAIDGTPVLDLKPHFPVFDSPTGATVAAWVETLMRGYF